MTTLIEQAAQRLEQLRQAGADMPSPERPPADSADATPVAAPGMVNRVASRKVDIDLDALGKAGIVSPNARRSEIADQFRVIKRPLIRNATGKSAAPIVNGNLIMVTSAIAGEGKTFTAINLAMSIASELDHTVLLVDADVSRPSVMRVLGLPAGPGLLDLVLDESLDISSALLKTSINKLTLLPSGTPHPRATELLASESMVQLLRQLAQRYPDRLIIFDSPPLLLATEARVLASHMGQVVMVVRAESTLQSDVVQALATIEACPVKLMLLNQSRTSFQGGYEYGYGEEQEQEQGYALGLGQQAV